MVASLAALAVGAPGAAAAATGSLYSGPAPRPGPDILYAPLADASQLDNAPGSIWRAPPILVSGASAYRSGEFLYQDFLYDDHGAREQRDPGDRRMAPGGNSSAGDSFSAPNGTYTYPTDPRYANNAADLVELRVRPLSDATAFRITLNTLHDPNLVGTSIAIGGTPGVPKSFPDGANVSAPAQMFLTVHGSSAELVDAVTKQAIPGGAPTVSVDMARRQITVLVPHSAWNPSGVVRLAAGVGLWDTAANRFLTPRPRADATHPGGAGTNPLPPAFFNVAFRYNAQEPLPDVHSPGAAADTAWWRDMAQGHALAGAVPGSADISAFHADVDFAKLAAQANDDMPGQPTGVPQTGAVDRIMASHFETEQGADYSQACSSSAACQGELRGQLQPYAIYVPPKPMPAGGYGLTLLLHSLGANYNQYLGSHNQSQFGDRGPGSIIITAEGRGTDGWYYDYAGADTFEMWADTAARYRLEPAYTDIAGYSMGGYATYKFATQFPDLFAKAQPTVGPPGLGVWVPPADPQPGAARSLTARQLGSVRNIPFLIWNEASDELVPYAGVVAQVNQLRALGYRYEFDTFTVGEHLTLAINDQFAPAADFLGTDVVDRNPPHVTYTYNPTMDFPAVGTTAGHAYWVSALRLRDGGGAAPLGTIDVRSQAFGVGDRPVLPVRTGAGALTGGTLPAIPFASATQAWGPGPPAAARDALDITVANLSTLTIDAARARVDCRAQLNVSSDGPVTVNLVSCPGGETLTRFFAGRSGVCASLRHLVIHPYHPRGTRVLSAVVLVNGHRLRSLRAHGARASIHRIALDLRGRPRTTVHVLVKMRVRGRDGRVRTLADRRTYHTCIRRLPRAHRSHRHTRHHHAA